MSNKPIRAWHFVGNALRDGRPVPADGVWLKHDGPLVMCTYGLHASVEPFDALKYAPGPILCLVECHGQIIRGLDKLVCSERRILTRMNATDMLRYYARMQALSVVHLWDAPAIVLDYLMTGDEEIRDAAREAAVVPATTWAPRIAWAAGATWATGAAAWIAAGSAAEAATKATWAVGDAEWDVTKSEVRKDFNALVHECFRDWL